MAGGIRLRTWLKVWLPCSVRKLSRRRIFMSQRSLLFAFLALAMCSVLAAEERHLTAVFTPEAGPNDYTVQFPPELGGGSLFMPIVGGQFTMALDDDAKTCRLLEWEQQVAPVEILGRSSGDITVRIDKSKPSSGTYEPELGEFSVEATFILEFDDSQLRELGFISPFILTATEQGTIKGVGDIGTISMLLEGNGSVGPGGFSYVCRTTAKFAYGLPDHLAQPGDVNHDRNHDISDAVGMVGFLFLGEAVACNGAIEINGDGKRDISDPVYLLWYLFLDGPKPLSAPVACAE
jgi:hypothetical protein